MRENVFVERENVFPAREFLFLERGKIFLERDFPLRKVKTLGRRLAGMSCSLADLPANDRGSFLTVRRGVR